MDKVVCVYCEWHGWMSHPRSTLCPECRKVNSIDYACEIEGCWDRATNAVCMIGNQPTVHRYCYDHPVKLDGGSLNIRAIEIGENGDG